MENMCSRYNILKSRSIIHTICVDFKLFSIEDGVGSMWSQPPQRKNTSR